MAPRYLPSEATAEVEASEEAPQPTPTPAEIPWLAIAAGLAVTAVLIYGIGRKR